MFDSLKEFFEYKVSVQVKWNEMALDYFPAVTFCNLNPFDSRKESVKRFLSTQLESNNLNWSLVDSDEIPAIQQVNQALEVLKAAALSEFNSNSNRGHGLGFDLDSMIISCFYNGLKCNLSDFTKSFSFEYGNCYTFNKNTSKKTSKTGYTGGLTMEIFTGVPNKNDLFIEKRGIQLIVHNSSRKPLAKYEGVMLPVGSASNVAVIRTFSYRKESPYSNCRINSDQVLKSDSLLAEKTLKVSKYSQKLCYEICIQLLYVIDKCKCADPSVPIIDKNLKICSSQTSLGCVQSVRSRFDSMDLSANCSKLCPTECEKIMYGVTVSSALYPTYDYYKIIFNQSSVRDKFKNFSHIDYRLFRESALKVNVHYQELGYTSIEERQAYSIENLFGIIGGQLGLILGISILSFCEFLIFFLEVAIKIYKHKKKNEFLS